MVARPPYVDPGICPVHNMQITFWCYEDKTPLCLSCRLHSHHQHEVTRYRDKNEEQMSNLYDAVDEMVDLLDRMKETSKAIEVKRKKILSECKLFKNQVLVYPSIFIQFIDSHYHLRSESISRTFTPS